MSGHKRIKFIILSSVLLLVLLLEFVFSKESFCLEIQYNDLSNISVNNNNVYFSNLDIPIHGNDDGDPYLFYDKGKYYLYATGNIYYTSTNLKNWSNGKTSVAGLSSDNYYWAPEVYKIDNTYYLLQSHVHWGSGFPFAADSVGNITVATTNNLDNGFQLWKTININLENIDCNLYKNNNKILDYIDGTLMVDADNNGKVYTDANGYYYFYFKSECDQNIYVIRLNRNFDAVDKFPTKIVSKNSTITDGWGNDVAEGPQVWIYNGYYHMMYSSGNYSGTEGTDNAYAVGYAWSHNPMSGWTNQSTDNKKTFFKGENIINRNSSGAFYGSNISLTDYSSPIYAPGHNAVFIKTKKEFYNVYHSAYYQNNQYQRRKDNIQRMGYSYDGISYTNAPSNQLQPLISGTKFSGYYYYQLSDTNSITKTSLDDFSLSTSANLLTDGAIYGAMSSDINFKVGVTSVKEIKLTMPNRYNISDIWIASNGTPLNGKATLFINENKGKAYKYDVNLTNCPGASYYKKIQLPDISNIDGGIETIRIKFDSIVDLTEITPIRKCVSESCSQSSDTYSEKSYTITFNGNGGTGTSYVKNYGDKVGTLPNSIREGYTFDGWYTSASGGNRITSETIVSNNVTYYAHWTANSYTITFNGNGGTGTSYVKNYGETVGTLPSSAREGYTFDGWYTSATEGERVTSETKVSNDVTYYAHWILNSYTITFNGNGGTGTSYAKNYGDKVGALPSSIREGYTFDGWYTAATGGERVVSETRVLNNATYYAHWQIEVPGEKNCKLIVKYLEYNTNKELFETIEKRVSYGENYETASIAGISNLYKLKILPNNYKGTISSEITTVIYYYEIEKQNVFTTTSETGQNSIDNNINKPDLTASDKEKSSNILFIGLCFIIFIIISIIALIMYNKSKKHKLEW